MSEEYYVVDFGSRMISETDYFKIKNKVLTWEQWTVDNLPEVSSVMTEDYQEVKE